jgi:hypothetical protein
LQGSEPRRRHESHITCFQECKECKECEGNETSHSQVNPHCVATLALGLWPKQGVTRLRDKKRLESHITCSQECKECEGTNLHSPKWTPIVGVGLPNGLPNIQNAIAGVKTHWFEEFFISLENLLKHRCLKRACMAYLDIWNISYDQRKVGNQTDNLTPDY